MLNKRILGALLASLLVFAFCIVPVRAANQNFSTTWTEDTPHHKEASVVFTNEDGRFEAYFEVNVTRNSPANYTLVIDLTSLHLGNHTVGWVGTEEALTDEPTIGNVKALQVHFTADFTLLLTLAVAGTIVLIVVYFIIDLIMKFETGDLLGFISQFRNFISVLSLPIVVLQLLLDRNSDGTVGLHLPYYPLSHELDLLFNNHYYVATDQSWWEILKNTFYIWIIPIFTWLEAHWLSSRISQPPPPPIPPLASFTWFPPKPFVGESVTFMSLSFDPDGYITGYHWWFGDGYEAFSRNATHKYSIPGNYNVTLQVVDNDSLSAFDSQIIQVMVPAAIDINPSALNLRSKGMWITASIELPQDYSVIDINVSSILLNNTVPTEPKPVAVEDFAYGTPHLMVKFSRANVEEYVLDSVNVTDGWFLDVTLTITGCQNDGTLFQGSDTVTMISTHAFAMYWKALYLEKLGIAAE